MEDSDRLSQERQDQGGHWLSLNTVPGLLQHSTMWYDPLFYGIIVPFSQET